MTTSQPLVVTLNGTAHAVVSGTSLADMLQRQGHAEHSVATAVNGTFVPRSARAAHLLKASDQITCFQPIVGG